MPGEQLNFRRGRRSALIPLGVLISVLIGLLLMPDLSGFGIWAVLTAQLALFGGALQRLLKELGSWRAVAGDARFYLFTLLTVYGSIVPVLAVIDDVPTAHLRLLPHVQVAAESDSDIIRSQIGSFLLLAGVVVGCFLRWGRGKGAGEAPDSPRKPDASGLHPRVQRVLGSIGLLTAFWTVICAVSTAIFIYPFATGGFAQLRNGAAITDIETFGSMAGGSLAMTTVGFLFSAEVMTASTLILMSVLYLRYTRGGSTLPIVALILFHLGLALITTRTIRAVILLLGFCILASLPGPAKGRGPLRTMIRAIPVLVLALGAFNLAPSLLAMDGGDFTAPSTLPELLRSTDAVGPYDAYLRALGQEPDVAMGLNAFISLIAGLPFIGAPLLSLVGLEPVPPLAHWLTLEYPSIYRSGGGLAAMPQLEGYLTAGMLGIFATGLVFGALARQSRSVLGSLVMVAVSVLFARGSLGIVAQVSIPYLLVTVLLFGNVLASALRIPTLGAVNAALQEAVGRAANMEDLKTAAPASDAMRTSSAPRGADGFSRVVDGDGRP